MKKKLFALLLVVTVLFTLFPQTALMADASNAYTINGVTVHWDDFSSSPSECWAYANNVYKKIWGHNFTNSFNDSENSLRNLSDSELTLTAEHLKAYVSNAALGSCLRICDSEYLHGSDGWGHSQIIVQKDANGFTVFEGGLSASPYCREHYYTWSGYVDSSWPGGYAYIKYIKWPGATPISTGDLAATISDLNMPESIATGGNPELSGTITGNFDFTWVWVGIDHLGQYDHVSQAQTNPMTSTYDIGSLLNHLDFAGLSAGSYTLKVEATGGGKYWNLYAKNFTVKDGNMEVTGVSVPSAIYVRENVSITGTVSAAFPIIWVWAGVDTVGQYDHIIQAQANPMSASYSLNGLLSQLDLSILPIGNYTYKIEGICGYKYYVLYAEDFSIVAKPTTMTVTFNPNGGSVSPTSKTVIYGQTYGTLPTPTRTNYDFDGWYTASSGGSKVTSSTTVTATSDHTLYAHWTSNCASGHNYTYAVTTTPTTSATGKLTGTCSRCSATTTVTLPKLNTTDYTYAVTKAATCAATGTGRYTWKTTTYGSFYFDVTIAKTAHTYKDTVTAPTCTAQGYTTHICTGCGDTYKDTYTDALGHNWDGGIITTQPTETSKGIKTFTCTRCGATKTEPVPALNHTHSYSTVVTPPTCTEKGYTTYTCACGDSYVTDYVGAPGHNFVGGVCTRCGADDPNYNPPAPNDPCEGYTDIDRKAWYHTAADFVLERGLMGSTKADTLTFEPNTKVSRAMVASILYTMAGKPEASYKGTFTDVPAGKWFTTAIEWCAQNGLASGKGNGKFDPNGNVTRQELAVFMMQMAQYLGKDTSGRADLSGFADASKVPSWAKTYVQWAVDAGLISGKASGGKTYLAPADNASRAELAAIIRSFVQNIAE